MEIPIAELQVTLIIVALMVGAARGIIGYWWTAPESEPFNYNKLCKTAVRYAVVTFVGINITAYAGTVWTISGVIVYTLIQLAIDLGLDLKKT